MLAWTRCRLATTVPLAAPFAHAPEDAVAAVWKMFRSRWLSPPMDELEIGAPLAIFVPFYLCRGHVTGSYTATVTFTPTETRSQTFDSMTRKMMTRTVYSSPRSIDLGFHESSMKLYGGYRRSHHHLTSVLQHATDSLDMHPLSEVDLSFAHLDDFEMSTTTLRSMVKEVVAERAREAARAEMKMIHPDADTIQVSIEALVVKLTFTQPVYLPCYLVPVRFGGDDFTVYVSGRTGAISGPYLFRENLALTWFSAASHLMGVLTGVLSSIPVYYIASTVARHAPRLVRNYRRLVRRRRQRAHHDENQKGEVPTASASQRVDFERAQAAQRHEKEQVGGRARVQVADRKKYYALLGCEGHESLADIRQAFRKRALKMHPDVGGDPNAFRALAEAYRVLRDPASRRAYDDS